MRAGNDVSVTDPHSCAGLYQRLGVFKFVFGGLYLVGNIGGNVEKAA